MTLPTALLVSHSHFHLTLEPGTIMKCTAPNRWHTSLMHLLIHHPARHGLHLPSTIQIHPSRRNVNTISYRISFPLNSCNRHHLFHSLGVFIIFLHMYINHSFIHSMTYTYIYIYCPFSSNDCQLEDVRNHVIYFFLNYLSNYLSGYRI